jgi:hypothetical protein
MEAEKLEKSDSAKLNMYASSLPHGQKYRFLAKVAEGCCLTLPTVENWIFRDCSIRDIYKDRIEEIAGMKIFKESEP